MWLKVSFVLDMSWTKHSSGLCTYLIPLNSAQKVSLITFQNENLLFRQYHGHPYAVYARVIPTDGELCCIRYRWIFDEVVIYLVLSVETESLFHVTLLSHQKDLGPFGSYSIWPADICWDHVFVVGLQDSDKIRKERKEREKLLFKKVQQSPCVSLWCVLHHMHVYGSWNRWWG